MSITPEVAPANVAFLSAKLKDVEPAAVGLTAKRLSTIRSDLIFALRHLGLAGPGTYLVAMSPKWLALWRRLPTKYDHTSMSRLFRFCSGQGIQPAGVTDDVMDAFEEALRAETLIKNPRVTRQNACRAWNKLAGTVRGWPKVRVTVPRYTDHYILPWSAFPAGFAADVERHLARLGHVDLLDLNAPPRPLRAITLKNYRVQLRRFASMLVHCGHRPDKIRDVAYLVQPAHVQEGLRFLLARHGNKRLRAAFDLATLLTNVARHWVGAPKEHVDIIARYAKQVRPPAEGMGRKNRERLAPLRDERNLARLFMLPGKIRKEIEARRGSRRDDALLMQLAVALSILTYAPIRIGTLSLLRADRHLRWSAPRMGGELIINIDGEETKNGQSHTFPLPPDCASLIRLYLTKYHSRLVVGGNPFLFTSDLPGRPKRADTLGKQLSRLVRRSLGLEVNPHLYRHLVHLVVLNRFPGAYAMISRILGHRSLATAIRNYATEDMPIALRAYQDLVDDAAAGRVLRPTLRAVATGLDGWHVGNDDGAA
ncbi:MAG: tyrosine-type recombinase/integrase [Hyphomicrobiaceae bacterium]